MFPSESCCSPNLIGGIEASLRRVTHYDYWEDRLLPSILVDSKADMLVYGMGEKPIRQILELMNKGIEISKINNVRQTVFIKDIGETQSIIGESKYTELASHEI